MEWTPPHDLDHECLKLCEAMNSLPGITTVCSCCGHGTDTYRIYFDVADLCALPDLLYWFDRCHNGFNGWRVIVYTDCAKGGPYFKIEGPPGAFDEANEIARLILEDDQPAYTVQFG